MSIELYRDKNHACIMFTDLIEEDAQAVQANQFLIVDDDTGAIIDPGGNLAFNELFMGMTKHFPPPQAVVPDRLPRRPGHHCLAGPVAHQHQGIAGHLPRVGALCAALHQSGQDR